MNNDLISREALKKALKNRNECENCTDIDCINCFYDIIDNAPTVELPEQITIKCDCDTEEDKQKLLSLIANAKVCRIAEPERPQGEFEITNEDIQKAIKEGFANGYEMAKEKIIHSIAKQYSEHNELVPIWLSIGDIKVGAE